MDHLLGAGRRGQWDPLCHRGPIRRAANGILSRSRERNLFLTRENSRGRIKENRETILVQRGIIADVAQRELSRSTPTHNPRPRFPQAIVLSAWNTPSSWEKLPAGCPFFPPPFVFLCCFLCHTPLSTLHPRLIVPGDTLRTSADSTEHPNCWHNRGSNRVDGRARVAIPLEFIENKRDASIWDKIYFGCNNFLDIFRYRLLISYL